jgi:hypothetical protein
MREILVVLALVSIFLLLSLHVRRDSQYGGATMGPFSYLNEDISDGIDGSWSKRENIGSARWNARIEHGDGIPTFYGHGIPLLYEQRLPGKFSEEPMLIAHNLNPKIAPECCPSPFSTDRGCLCYNTLNSRWRI